MTTHTLTIPHTLRDEMRKSGLPFTTNEWRAAHWRKQNDAKKRIALAVWARARAAGLVDAKLTSVRITTTWHKPNAIRTDAEAMTFFQKAAIDSLVKCGALVADDHRHVLSATTAVVVDRGNPRITVEVTEVGE